MSTLASRFQQIIIDDQRTDQCTHKPAKEYEKLTFLSCRRCGIVFCEGVVRQQNIIRLEDERPGEFHAASIINEVMG